MSAIMFAIPKRSPGFAKARASDFVRILLVVVLGRSWATAAPTTAPEIEVSVIMDYGTVLQRVACAKGVGCLLTELARNTPAPSRIGVYASPSDAPWSSGEVLVADALGHRPAQLDRGRYPKLWCSRGGNHGGLELVSTSIGKPDASVGRLQAWLHATSGQLHKSPLWTDSLVLAPVASIGGKHRVAVRLASGMDRSAWIRDNARVKWLRADRADPVTGSISWSAQDEVRDSACIRAVARGSSCVLDVPGGKAWYKVEILGLIAGSGPYGTLLREPVPFELLTTWTRIE